MRNKKGTTAEGNLERKDEEGKKIGHKERRKTRNVRGWEERKDGREGIRRWILWEWYRITKGHHIIQMISSW